MNCSRARARGRSVPRAANPAHRQYEHGVPGDEKPELRQKGQTWEASVPTGNGRNRSRAVLNCAPGGLREVRCGLGGGTDEAWVLRAAGLKLCVELKILELLAGV